jgi:SNF2 family DNA or RNA helicase
MTRIYSGTPIDGSPFDAFSQINIVDPTFWARELKIHEYIDFKAFFGIFRREQRRANPDGTPGREFPILVTYQNIAVLRDLLKKISSRVLKDDVLDLPEKLYTKRYYEMSPAQERVYEALEKEYMADFPDDPEAMVTAELPIVRMTRLQQVLCGYVPADGDDEPRELIDKKNNPRADATTEFVSEAGNQQTIVWAQYRLDIDILMERLRAEGRKPVRYDGRVDEDERARAKAVFKSGDASDFVANTSVGAEGLTFVNTHTTAFHNNNYRMIKRKQAEDRVHRIGQREACLYGDMVCAGTRDERAIEILQKKHRVSEQILGDAPKEWL